MTRWARGFKKKHVEATSWDELQTSETAPEGKTKAPSTEDKNKEESQQYVENSMSKYEIKKEKNREARRKRRGMKKICFHCRRPGHPLSKCPSLGSKESPGDICFKCGSTEHKINECKTKVAKDQFPFAKCFICGQDGHLSRSCTDNPRGLYPHGGGCNICGSVEHFKRDCPENLTSNIETTKSKSVEIRAVTDVTSADAVTFSSGEEDEEKEKEQIQVKTKKPKLVKF